MPKENIITAEEAEDSKARIAELEAKIAALKKEERKRVYPKVAAKGGMSVYGLGRFPVTLYKSQWERLFEMVPELQAFLIEHSAEFASKENGKS